MNTQLLVNRLRRRLHVCTTWAQDTFCHRGLECFWACLAFCNLLHTHKQQQPRCLKREGGTQTQAGAARLRLWRGHRAVRARGTGARRAWAQRGWPAQRKKRFLRQAGCSSRASDRLELPRQGLPAVGTLQGILTPAGIETRSQVPPVCYVHTYQAYAKTWTTKSLVHQSGARAEAPSARRGEHPLPAQQPGLRQRVGLWCAE